MRPERSLKTLEDIRDAASFILEVTKNKSREEYLEKRLLRQAVERNFEIIGEAIGRLAREDPETVKSIGEHGRIVAFRNVLIHGYDLVDDELVWDTIETKTPVLLAEVESLIYKELR
ncbi:MAG: HepT-like ribonuclease domain-containing protein [Rubrobacteraceae bacterium]